MNGTAMGPRLVCTYRCPAPACPWCQQYRGPLDPEPIVAGSRAPAAPRWAPEGAPLSAAHPPALHFLLHTPLRHALLQTHCNMGRQLPLCFREGPPTHTGIVSTRSCGLNPPPCHQAGLQPPPVLPCRLGGAPSSAPPDSRGCGGRGRTDGQIRGSVVLMGERMGT